MVRREVPQRPVPGDAVAGISIALVLVPQAVAYASLAGLPPSSGLLAAAAAPIAAAFFASSPYLATGPVAITSLLVLGGLATVAEPMTGEYVALAALLAVFVGAIRLVLGVTGGGVLAYLMSQPALAAFTAAAGLLILLSQVSSAVGVPASSDNPVASGMDALAHPGAWNLAASAYAAVTVAAMLVARRFPATFPVVPLIVVVTELVASATGTGGPSVGSIDVTAPSSPLGLPWGSSADLIVPAAVIALVGFAEPSAIARRLAADDRQHWSADRELVSQGVANIASGLVGGYPVGGSFSRSTLNRLVGARTRWSGLATGLVVLAMLPVMGLLADLPKAVLAGIVIASVVSIVDPRPVLRFWRLSKVQFVIAAVTYTSALVLAPRVDLAVVIGVGLAVGVHLWRELHLRVPSDVDGDVLHVRPHGVLYFASTPGLEDAVNDLLAEHPDTRTLVVHLDRLGRMDLTGALALRDLVRELREAGVDAGVCSIPPQSERIVGRVLPEYVRDDCRHV